MKIRILSCFFLLITLLPHQAKADGVVGKAIKLTKEKLKVMKPGGGAPNAGVQTGYSAILRAPKTADYPSILGTMRFSTIRTTQNPNGSGNVNIACGGSLLSGPCTNARRNVNQVNVSYTAENFNFTDMRQTNLSLVGADPNILLPSHWVYSIIGNFDVQMTGNTGPIANSSYQVKYFTDWGNGPLQSYYDSKQKQPYQFLTTPLLSDMSGTVKKN
jgi:hypothetical protein